MCPGRVRTFRALGVDLVIGRREGYRIWDLDGHELLDLHLNGGVFNLGHRNPELVATLRDALDTLDVGNHHFPSAARAELAEPLARLTPGDLHYSVFASGGGEAIDVALKTARHATKRRKIVSIAKGYHGHTGLALAAGDERFSRMFLSRGRAGRVRAGAVERPRRDGGSAVRRRRGGGRDRDDSRDAGLPAARARLPGARQGAVRAARRALRRRRSADRSRPHRHAVGVEQLDVEPDILVTGKGLSGGLYPIAATVLSRRVAGWLDEDGWGHVSTFGGAEVGCRVAQRGARDHDPARRRREREGGRRSTWATGSKRSAAATRTGCVEIRRAGLVMGLRFADPQGAMRMTRALYESGLWAMFAGHDPSVLQFKPGLLADAALRDEMLARFEAGVERCRASLA